MKSLIFLFKYVFIYIYLFIFIFIYLHIYIYLFINTYIRPLPPYMQRRTFVDLYRLLSFTHVLSDSRTLKALHPPIFFRLLNLSTNGFLLNRWFRTASRKNSLRSSFTLEGLFDFFFKSRSLIARRLVSHYVSE